MRIDMAARKVAVRKQQAEERCSKMKVVCINNDGMSAHLTFGMVYRLDCFVSDGTKCRLLQVDGDFLRDRFLVVDLDHDAKVIVGQVISMREARTLGQWPGQVRQKNCKCDIPPGVHCEYHGP
jgi:hypothetical protein